MCDNTNAADAGGVKSSLHFVGRQNAGCLRYVSVHGSLAVQHAHQIVADQRGQFGALRP